MRDSVTGRVKRVVQPHGGYLPVRSMEKICYEDGRFLSTSGLVYPGLQGTVVDSLFRMRLGDSPEEAFSGAFRAVEQWGVMNRDLFDRCVKTVSPDTEVGIRAALSLADLFQYGFMPGFGGVTVVKPDCNDSDICNIGVMVDRLERWVLTKEVTSVGFTMVGGYTNMVSTGDGDLLTTDGVWDIKVSGVQPTSRNTLQLLMYWRMGINSKTHGLFDVPYLGVFNPKLNAEWKIGTSSIPFDVVLAVESDVIGYGGVAQLQLLASRDYETAALRDRAQAIRAWAGSQGISVNSRGTISANVVELYNNAHPGMEDELEALRQSVRVYVDDDGVSLRLGVDDIVWPSWSRFASPV